MVVDFNKLSKMVFPELLGGKNNTAAWISDDGTNQIMLTMLEPGASIGRHVHEDDCECIYMISGTGTMLFDDTSEELRPGVVHYCPMGHSHSMVNEGTVDLVYVSFVAKQPLA